MDKHTVLQVLAAGGLGAVTGLLGAAKTDYEAFQTWKSVSDAKTYDWGVAVWRWFKGAAVGFVGGIGTYAAAHGVSLLVG